LYDKTRRGKAVARPTDRGEAKSEVLNIRVTPTLKAKLETEAKLKGSKLSAECEERLQASMEKTDMVSTPETRGLLDEIEATIAEIERGTGNHWHQGLGTWAAVAEMLAQGPIVAHAPTHITEGDDELRQLFQEQIQVMDERDRIKNSIDLITGEGGLNWLLGPEAVADQVDAKDYPDGLKTRIKELIEHWARLDKEYVEQNGRIDALLEPLIEAIEQGRASYPKPPTSFVLAAALNRLEIRNKWMPSLGALVARGVLYTPYPPTAPKRPTLGEFVRSGAKGNDV
jgi:hypothetical protein